MSSYRWLLPAGFVLLLVPGCGASAPGGLSDLSGTHSDGGFCQPGQTQSCVCLGGSTGLQTCRATASSFGPCIACGTTTSTDMAVSMGNPCGDCNGCCSGSTCVGFANESNSQCGGRGETCAPCTGTNTCNATGVCSTTGTMTCSGCTYGTACSNGQCTMNVDPAAMFKMIVKEIVFDSTDSGSDWDPFNENPCPFICVSFTANGTTQTGCNKYCTSTLDCVPPAGDDLVGNSDGSSDATTPLYIPGSVLINGGLQITGYDYDSLSSNDVGGQMSFPATTTFKSSFMTGPFNSVMNVTFQLQ